AFGASGALLGAATDGAHAAAYTVTNLISGFAGRIGQVSCPIRQILPRLLPAHRCKQHAQTNSHTKTKQKALHEHSSRVLQRVEVAAGTPAIANAGANPHAASRTPARLAEVALSRDAKRIGRFAACEYSLRLPAGTEGRRRLLHEAYPRT